MCELYLVHLFDMRDSADVDSVSAGLAEHVGADQPLDNDGEVGGEVVPGQHQVQDDAAQRDEVEGEDEPGGPYDRLHLARVEL